MKVFIIHKGSDNSLARLIKDYIYEKCKVDVLVLENGGKLWKLEAAKMIKQAQMVLYLVGENSSKSENIGWEIKSSLKHNKLIYCVDLKKYQSLSKDAERLRSMVGNKNDTAIDTLRDELFQRLEEIDENITSKTNDNANDKPNDKTNNNTDKNSEPDCYEKHSALNVQNQYTKDFRLSALVKDFATTTAVVEHLKKYIAGDYEIFNSLDDMSDEQLIEQYKVYLATSEELIARRQNVNNFYITLNAAIVTLSSTILALCDDMISKLFILAGMSVTGIMLDICWIHLLEAYGTLNASKIKIISLIERRLPVSLYDQEWAVMSDKLNSKKYVSFTDSEKRIPKLFCILYSVMLLVFVVLIILKRLEII